MNTSSHGGGAQTAPGAPLDRHAVVAWLRESDPIRLDRLWEAADHCRRERVGDAVHLRALIEFGNVCRRRCLYCGLRGPNRRVRRYRMGVDAIREAVRQACSLGFGTVVLQSGEDPAFDLGEFCDLVRWIKKTTPLAVTLSLGERTPDELAALREAGADRYLLRFETSNRRLYERIHPPVPGQTHASRFELLAVLRELGYEVGSGVMIGIPGQTWDDLAEDLLWFRRLDLDMIGVGPYIPHPDTPMGRERAAFAAPSESQVPADELTTYKVIALTRLLCPDANIPATTALATLDPVSGRETALRRGANVIMPNVTPPQVRPDYQIYPGKVCVNETGTQCAACIRRRIARIGRVPGVGRGDSPNWHRRNGRPILQRTSTSAASIGGPRS